MNNTPLTHDEAIARIKQLADELQQSGFSFYLIAGKDNLCSCFARTTEHELEAMIQSMQVKQPQVHNVIKNALSNPKN